MSEKRGVFRCMVLSAPIIVMLIQIAPAIAARKDNNGITYIARIEARPGTNKALLSVLSERHSLFPGCLYFSTVQDRKNPDVFLTIEVWKDEESHSAAIKTPEMQHVIARSRPLLAAYEPVAEADVLTMVAQH